MTMAFVALSTVSYDPLGYIYAPGRMIDQAGRRTTVAKALDGTVIIDDAGFNIGDQSAQLTLTAPTSNEVDRVKRMVRLYSEHRLSIGKSVYRGVISRYFDDGRGGLRIDFDIEESEVTV